MSYVTLEDINFECFENFPNSGFTSLNFPIRKALRPLSKIAKKKIPVSFGNTTRFCFNDFESQVCLDTDMRFDRSIKTIFKIAQ